MLFTNNWNKKKCHRFHTFVENKRKNKTSDVLDER